MKTLVLFICVFLIYGSAKSQGLYDITSGDASMVIACGKNGIILRSTNSGNNWTSTINGSVDLFSVCSISSTYWITGAGGVCLKSTDSGLSWSQQQTNTTSSLKSIYFLDNLTGWAAGSAGVILRSTNGGVNWSQQSSGTSSDLNSIKFSSSSTGFVCGKSGILLRSTNGGSNWSPLNTGTARELFSVDIKNNVVMVSGEYSTALRSTNSGASWSAIDYKQITLSDINSVFMQDENTYFSCGGGGFIRRSTDGGLTFTFCKNPMFGDLYSIHFYNQNTGWAVSRKTYAVIHTTDGGNTWQLPAGTTVDYTWRRTLLYGYNQTFGDAITAFNPFNKNVMYVLVASRLYRSSNLGENWVQISTLPYAAGFSQFLAVSPYDTSKFVAVLQQPGRVYYTSNYGTNWLMTHASNINGVGIPVEVSPQNPDTLYMGNTTTLYRSTNFGLNWNTVSTLPSTYGTCDIEISYNDPSLMNYATGQPARIFRSTNAGLNFTLVNSDSAIFGEVPAMSTNPYDVNLIYHLFFGSNGKDGVWKSTNFGSNWTRIAAIPYTWGIATASDDPNVIIAGVWDNVQRPAHISTDGGVSFFQTNPIDNAYSGNEVMYAYDRGNIIAQQTNGLFKLSVTYNVPAIGIQPISSEIPQSYELLQNYPNPFNPATKIKFSIPLSRGVDGVAGRGVLLEVYDVLGKEIAVLVNQNLKPGIYEIEWDATNIPSGVYFYSLITNDFTQTKKMVVLK